MLTNVLVDGPLSFIRASVHDLGVFENVSIATLSRMHAVGDELIYLRLREPDPDIGNFHTNVIQMARIEIVHLELLSRPEGRTYEGCI